ncbi:cytochrome c [Xanthomonas campestris]|uniref:c-type cytochrome n=1 Tax=Xanthomonas TaxID=338 RepID=UPI001E633988|nr:cytochrome c [Xanthomonas campestris]MCC5091207.1 cytochrome c [Xanthomonas campestris]
MKKLKYLLLACVVAAVLVAWYVNRTPASAFDGQAMASNQAPSPALLRQGEYVARLSDCVACHSTPGHAPFTGGLGMESPLGTITTTNITPDKDTGIGQYSLADFDRALRHGVAKDGHRLYPAMPYPSYAKLSDQDVTALYAYFMHGVKPVRRENESTGIKWPLNMRWPLALWSGVFTESGSYKPVEGKDAQWNRGAYIVEGPGHCGSCHTPRGLAFNEQGLHAADPDFLSGALLDGWYAPNLRGDAKRGIGTWAEDDMFQFLKTGRNKHAVVFGSMTEAFNNSLQYLTDQDLRAVSHYLKTLPADPSKDGAAYQYDASSNQALGLAQRSQHPGAQTFMARCSSCHGVDGRGQAPWIPPLAGATSSMVEAGDSQINVTLNGSDRIVAANVPDAYRMPPFRKQLSDAEIAEVVSFVRTSWGNDGGKVDAKDVEKLRASTDPANPTPVQLQMR